MLDNPRFDKTDQNAELTAATSRFADDELEWVSTMGSNVQRNRWHRDSEVNPFLQHPRMLRDRRCAVSKLTILVDIGWPTIEGILTPIGIPSAPQVLVLVRPVFCVSSTSLSQEP